MTSAINTSGINASFPTAGISNSSQGFRDNFSHIKTGLDTAKSEISALQIKGPGYSSGSGGEVTQTTSKSTGVVLNTLSGKITMHNASLAANTRISFTLTNSMIAENDIIVVHRGSAGSAGSYLCSADGVANGSCLITLWNMSLSPLAESIVLHFAVTKGATA